MKHIWVVEMRSDVNYRWEPTVGVGLCRADARREMKQWKKITPFDKFRLKKYVRLT